ncbi:MAG TPA: N-acetylglucosamine-6-phosphate deacetylase [Vicinamibacterales bacterium]|nr:N-acetylglucosamine-6-phosphate deacetylase [Vicinamibacterales bacterium]
MVVLSGAALVLPDRMLSPGTLVIDGDRIVDVRSDAPTGHAPSLFHGHYIVPGFIDVHVHGVDGIDSLDAGDAVASIARRLPRYGVTAFCPTTVACEPFALRGVLDQVRLARAAPAAHSARVLPAHLESNFINPEYRGAQPAACLRSPKGSRSVVAEREASAERGASADRSFSAQDILDEIARAEPDVAIVTLAPELEGGLDLVAALTARGHRVSLGHSAATYDEALAAIAAGARQATHLFNRMPPLHHRAPGLAGAVLQAEEVAAEIICDGVHVHPALVRAAIAAKRPSRVMAITDASAAAGLPIGAHARLGGQDIVAGDAAAHLADGTLAGSTLTMDRAFQMLVERIGLSLVDAATLCSTTAARELGLVGHGVLKPDAVADVVVLDGHFRVVQTYVAGQLVYTRNNG